MSRWLAGLIAAGTLVQFVPGSAAQQPTPAASPPAIAAPSPSHPVASAPGGGPAMTMTQVPPSGNPITIEAGKGTLIRLNAPAATVFIANPDIADVQVKSPQLIYLSAKQPGETVVYAVDPSDNVLLHSPVRVEHDLSRVRDSMRQLMPGENINVNSVDNSLVLSGDVSTAAAPRKPARLPHPSPTRQTSKTRSWSISLPSTPRTRSTCGSRSPR
jgi:Flp pilus assembly secretin CpaC